MPMAEPGTLPLPIVDGLTLHRSVREALRPGEQLVDRQGRKRTLPRYFYEVDSWGTALDLPLAAHFMLWELMGVDVRETAAARTFPRYVPCAVTLLAAHLEVLREAVGTYVHIAANGGYRSPAHALTRFASTHCWGTAANIYRIGDDYLDSRERIERYAGVVRDRLPAVWTRPYGPDDGAADDHLHIDLAYVVAVPRDAGSEGDTGQGGQRHGG
jgi:hypothetical protein